MVKRTTVKEDFTAASQDAHGGTATLPDPVETGDPFANRNGTDQLSDNERETVDVPGVGDVSKADTLRALLSKLSTLPPEVLARIADEMSLETDIESDPSGETNGLQGQNLASIATHENVKEIFAGETLSEAFKEKTALIFEAALGARLTILEAELEEKNQLKIQEAVQNVTEEIVDQIDRYLSYAAEEYINENKATIETSIRATVAEEFMEGVLNLARQYNIDVPESKVNVVEALSNQVEELEVKLTESLDKVIDLTNQVKGFKQEKTLEVASEGLTLTQKERLRALSESVETKSVVDYAKKMQMLKESILATSTPLQSTIRSEVKHDGVPLLESVTTQESTPEMKKILSALKNINR